MSSKRLHAVSIKEEATEATVSSTVFSAGNGSYLVIDPQINFDPARYQRNINRSSLTPLQGLSGVRKGTLRFGLEMTGTNAFSSVPQFGLPLRGCGFRQETLIKMTIGAITGGPFRHGETVTQTGSTATAMVVRDTYTGQTDLWITNQNDLGNGTAFTPTGLLTGGSSGATATPTGFATRLTFATTTGVFTVGEVATQATTTASGVVTSVVASGAGYIVVVRQTTTASFNTTNVVTGGTSAATGTPTVVSTQAQAGYGWWPQSYALSWIRFNGSGLVATIADGDLLKGVTSGALFNAFGTYGTTGVAQQKVYSRRVNGHTSSAETITNVTQGNTAGVLGTAPNESQFQIPSLTMGVAKDGVRESIKFSRGTFSMQGQIGEPMIFNFEFQGAFNEVTDQGNVTGDTFAQTTPAVLLDADLGLGGSATTFANEFIPCIKNFGITWGNEIGFQECMADSSGITNTIITGRKPTGSFDPDLNAEAVYPHMSDFLNNTAFRARFTFGSSLGNQFLIAMPALSTTQANTGDRNGISTRELQFELTGGSQTVSAFNVENELVIIAPYA